MKIITLWQPWASLIALGLKQFETRSWATAYRGPLAIHAAKRKMTRADIQSLLEIYKIARCHDEQRIKPEDLPLGAIVAECNLVDCLYMVDTRLVDPRVAMEGRTFIETKSRLERTVGGWSHGRYAWKLDSIRQIDPIPFKGRQGLRDLPIAI